MKRILQVLLVSPLPPPRGGIGTWTELIVARAKEDPEIDLHVVDISPRWRRHHQLEMWRRVLGGGGQLARDAVRIWRAIKRQRPSVLHLCTSGQLAFIRDLLILSFARFSGIHTVYHIRFGRVPELSKRGVGWEWRLARRAFSLADTVVALDERTLVAIQKQFPRKSVVKLPNCLGLEELEQADAAPIHSDRKPGVLRATYVGWVIPTKGVLELVQASSRVGSQLPFEVDLIGPADPDYLAEIRRAGATMGERLRIRGELTHSGAMQAMRQSDFLVLPSYTEGFPNVVMEAMALGKPVIATDVGAIPEMLSDAKSGLCGLVVPPKDVGALERALVEVLSDADRRVEMGLQARAVFRRRYSLDVVFGQLKKIWRNGDITR